ncbi:MAG TPA: hypothetical protein VFH31_06015, partial [Pyrinomonadaceae bacterium]|nr:hypothetical protein [Pyrinomonadaceae bacterium]
MTFNKQNLATSARGPTDKALAFWEIVSVITSCLIGEWVIFSIGRGSSVALAVLVIIVFAFMFRSHQLRGES